LRFDGVLRGFGSRIVASFGSVVVGFASIAGSFTSSGMSSLLRRGDWRRAWAEQGPSKLCSCGHGVQAVGWWGRSVTGIVASVVVSLSSVVVRAGSVVVSFGSVLRHLDSSDARSLLRRDDGRRCLRRRAWAEQRTSKLLSCGQRVQAVRWWRGCIVGIVVGVQFRHPDHITGHVELRRSGRQVERAGSRVTVRSDATLSRLSLESLACDQIRVRRYLPGSCRCAPTCTEDPPYQSQS
jgi:hypothetical protein